MVQVPPWYKFHLNPTRLDSECSLMLLLVPGKQEGSQDHLFGKLQKEKHSGTVRVHPGEAAISNTPRKRKKDSLGAKRAEPLSSGEI